MCIYQARTQEREEETDSPDLGEVPRVGNLFLPSAGDFNMGASPASGSPSKGLSRHLGGGASLLVPLQELFIIQKFA